MGTVTDLFSRHKTFDEEAVLKTLHKFHEGVLDVVVASQCPEAIVGMVCSTFAAQAAVALGLPRHEFLESMAGDFDAAVADSAEVEIL